MWAFKIPKLQYLAKIKINYFKTESEKNQCFVAARYNPDRITENSPPAMIAQSVEPFPGDSKAMGLNPVQHYIFSWHKLMLEKA